MGSALLGSTPPSQSLSRGKGICDRVQCGDGLVHRLSGDQLIDGVVQCVLGHDDAFAERFALSGQAQRQVAPVVRIGVSLDQPLANQAMHQSARAVTGLADEHPPSALRVSGP